MKKLTLPVLLGVTISVLLAFSGCGKGGPPEPLSPDRAATELTLAFAKSKPDMKEMAVQAVADLQAKRYPQASALLMRLSQTPELGEKEREIATRAMIGVNRLIKEAQAKGDPESTEYLRRLQQSR